MKLYVIRHGQTDWNIKKVMQGQTDVDINEVGIMQAKEQTERCKELKIKKIISSPLVRCKHVADIISTGLNVDVEVDDALKERNYGEFEGTSKSSFDYNKFWDYYKDEKYTKAENVKLFFDRVYSFLEKIRKYNNGNILIITHAGVMKAINCYFNGIPNDDTSLGNYLPDNCEVIEYDL